MIANGSYAPGRVQRLICDKAADGDVLRQRMADRGIDLITPRVPSRRHKVTDGSDRARWVRTQVTGVLAVQSTGPVTPLRLRGAPLAAGDERIPPRSCGQTREVTDGRKPRSYRGRWEMERTFAWPGSCRRLLARHGNRLRHDSAFFRLACIITVLSALLNWF